MSKKSKLIDKYSKVDDVTVCKECGRSFAFLGCHLAAHGITARDYKIKHSIALSVPLCSADHRRRLRDFMRGRIQEDPEYMERMSAMPKQIGRRRRREGPLIGKRFPEQVAARAKQIAIAAKLWEGRRTEFEQKWRLGVDPETMALYYACSRRTIYNRALEWSLPHRGAITAQPAQPLPCLPSPAS